MTREDVEEMLLAFHFAYPLFYKGYTSKDTCRIVDLWLSFFKDYEFDLVVKAARNYIANDIKGVPPVIGMILHEIKKIKAEDMDVSSCE